MSFVFTRTYVKMLTCDGQLGHHCPIKFRLFLYKGGKMSYIAHLKLDDIPGTGET